MAGSRRCAARTAGCPVRFVRASAIRRRADSLGQRCSRGAEFPRTLDTPRTPFPGRNTVPRCPGTGLFGCSNRRILGTPTDAESSRACGEPAHHRQEASGWVLRLLSRDKRRQFSALVVRRASCPHVRRTSSARGKQGLGAIAGLTHAGFALLKSSAGADVRYVRGAYRLCNIRSLPSGSLKNAMWQTPVSNVSPRNSMPLASRSLRLASTSSTCNAM